jgi:pimeloyl-ACP methyl ester carboxylesterase
MPTLHPRKPRTTTLGVRGGTTYYRLAGKTQDGLHPVIVTHGWPQAQTALQTVDLMRIGYLNFLIANGYTLYIPFTGSNWGHPTDTFPDVGGTGLGAFDDMVDAAEADGLDASAVHLFGTSMGGCNALNWAWRNSNMIGRIYLLLPLTDFGATWDTTLANTSLAPGATTIRQSLLNVHGGTDRASFLTAAADCNPAANAGPMTLIGSRTKAHLLTTDEVVPYAAAATVLENAGATVTTSLGSHFFPDGFGSIPAWDWSEYDIAKWFR